MKYTILLIIGFLPGCVQAQFVIAEGTAFSVAPGSDITIVSSGDVVNTTTDNFSTINLRLILVGNQDKAMEGNFVLRNLDLGTSKNDNGSTALQGDVTVTDGMAFKGGVLRVPETSSILFTGVGTNIAMDDPGENDLSFIDGAFYQSGGGERRFPIGKGENFLPVIFSNVVVDGTIGVEAFVESSGISPHLNVVEIDATRHWRVYADNVSQIASPVSLYDRDALLSQGGTVVAVEADPADPDLKARDLGNGASPDYPMATSLKPLTYALLAIGKTDEVTVRIHDLITPFGSNAGENPEVSNDGLYIDNLFETNEIVLMDRWGVVLKKWTNYKNGTDAEFFRTLMPGNYICVVKTEDSQKNVYEATQMITLLRTK